MTAKLRITNDLFFVEGKRYRFLRFENRWQMIARRLPASASCANSAWSAGFLRDVRSSRAERSALRV